jgi:hypothetical protein
MLRGMALGALISLTARLRRNPKADGSRLRTVAISGAEAGGCGQGVLASTGASLHVPPSNEKKVSLHFDHPCSLIAISAILRPW